MRSLKFRAWDKITKKYYVVSTLEYADNGELCEVWLADMLVTDPELNEACRNPKDVVLEQYTGLKDKNGKEIYEGDIVQTLISGVWTTGSSDAIFGEKMWELVVFWSDDDFGFLFKVIGSKNQPNRVYDILNQHLGAFEVIGNIHENPELLGGRK